MELTPAIRSYVEKKVSAVTKFAPTITQADVDIGRRTHHHKKGRVFYAEVNLHLPRKMVRVVEDSEDLYEAIDLVKDHAKTQLIDTKERRTQRQKERVRHQKEYETEE